MKVFDVCKDLFFYLNFVYPKVIQVFLAPLYLLWEFPALCCVHDAVYSTTGDTRSHSDTSGKAGLCLCFLPSARQVKVSIRPQLLLQQ